MTHQQQHDMPQKAAEAPPLVSADLTASGASIGNRGLPIWERMGEVLSCLSAGNRLILSSPTGSGKTTQIPQALYHAGFAEAGKIYVVENRVVVAVETARRVAQEMGVRIGEEVGFLTGPEKRASRGSKLLFVTSGVFRQILRRDPMLSEASVILLDEFDERDLLTDLSAALIDKAQSRGSQVKFVLMSATLNARKFSEHFDGAPVIEAQGRMFPVETHFPDPRSLDELDYPDLAATIAADLHSSGRPGDILIFMPGKPQISDVERSLRRLKVENALVLPLHGELPSEERQRAFLPSPLRKIVIATNIAERGVTIDGIVHVIDSGLVRMQQYDPNSDATVLPIAFCAQDACTQRKGRAGRTQPGHYYPLFSEEDLRSREPSTAPEIQRTPLRDVVLQIKAMGYSRLEDPLRIIDYPEKQKWQKAKEQLRWLGALNTADERQLSEFGERVAELGCGSRDAAMILHGCALGCGREVVAIAAVRMSRKLLYRPRGEELEADRAHAQFRRSKSSDLVNLLHVYQTARKNGFSGSWCKSNFVSWQALREVRMNEEQISKRALAQGCRLNAAPCNDESLLCQAIVKAFSDRIYAARGGLYFCPLSEDWRELGRESAVIRPESGLVAANELLTIPGRRTRRLITAATAVSREWLPQGITL